MEGSADRTCAAKPVSSEQPQRVLNQGDMTSGSDPSRSPCSVSSKEETGAVLQETGERCDNIEEGGKMRREQLLLDYKIDDVQKPYLA